MTGRIANLHRLFKMKRMGVSAFSATLLALGWGLVATAASPVVTVYDGQLGTSLGAQGWTSVVPGLPFSPRTGR